MDTPHNPNLALPLEVKMIDNRDTSVTRIWVTNYSYIEVNVWDLVINALENASASHATIAIATKLVNMAKELV